jgi:hypothetical protein
MNDLGGALQALAGHAAAPAIADPEALWRRGYVRVRTRRATAAAGMLVVGVIAVLAVRVAPAPTIVMPAGPVHTPAIPMNIHSPSKWLSSTADGGPLGDLAALGRATRGDGDAVFGIAATTGTYRYLALPHRLNDTDVALSPSGRYVAYWLTGRVTSTSSDVEHYKGYAVYDSRTGRTTEHEVPSERGVRPDSWGDNLFWRDDSTLFAYYGIYRGKGGSTDQTVNLWSPRTGALLSQKDGEDVTAYHAVSGGALVAQSGTDLPTDTFTLLTDTLASTADKVVVPAGSYYQFDRRGDRVVVSGIKGNGGISRIRSGTISGHGKTRLDSLGLVVNTRLLGWLSDDHVLVAGQPGKQGSVSDPSEPDLGDDTALEVAGGTNNGYADFGLYDYDLGAGTVKRLGTADQDGDLVQVARSLVASPMVVGLVPPDPVDPRIRDASIAGGVILVIGAVLLLVRRRIHG